MCDVSQHSASWQWRVLLCYNLQQHVKVFGSLCDSSADWTAAVEPVQEPHVGLLC